MPYALFVTIPAPELVRLCKHTKLHSELHVTRFSSTGKAELQDPGHLLLPSIHCCVRASHDSMHGSRNAARPPLAGLLQLRQPEPHLSFPAYVSSLPLYHFSQLPLSSDLVSSINALFVPFPRPLTGLIIMMVSITPEIRAPLRQRCTDSDLCSGVNVNGENN